MESRSSLFQNRDFLLLWGGRGISELGDFFGELTLSWLVYTMTGSAIALSLNLVIFFVPRSAVRLYAGVYVDKWNRRDIMITTETIRGVLFAAIGIFGLYAVPSVALVYLLSFFVGLFGALFELANEALLPTILDKSMLLTANSVFTATFQVDNVLGPALAGASIYLFGTSLPLLIDSASFFLLVIALVFVRHTNSLASGQRRTSGWFAEFKEGLQFFKQHRELVWLAIIVSIINFGMVSFWNVYLLVFSTDVLHVGAAGWGLLSAASAVGIFGGSTLVARRGKVRRRKAMIVASLLSLGLSVLVFAFALNIIASLAVVFLVGFAIPFGDVLIVTLYQEIVPADLMGRVFGVRFFLAYMLIPIGLLFGGIASAQLGVMNAIATSGLLIFATGAVALPLRSLNKLDDLSPRGAVQTPSSPS